MMMATTMMMTSVAMKMTMMQWCYEGCDVKDDESEDVGNVTTMITWMTRTWRMMAAMVMVMADVDIKGDGDGHSDGVGDDGLR